MKETRFNPARLRALRDRLFSIEEIAVAVGVSGRTVANWESGKGQPNATQLAALARLAGKPLDFFFERVA